MREVRRWRIPATEVSSLVWRGDDLYDPLNGWTTYRLDGTHGREHGGTVYRYPFDRVVTSPSGAYSAPYTALQTKGLLLHGASVQRELNRSYYCASSYEYPITFMQLPDGSDALIHCPYEYGRIEIERADTGERLTSRTSDMRDVFHSRLQVSSDNRYLLSTGWFWHPFGTLHVYDLHEALTHPQTLDSRGILPWGAIAGEVQSAAFLDNDHVLVATGDEPPLDDEWEAMGAVGPQELAVWSLATRRWVSRVPLRETLGTMMPLGTHVVGFYEHPKLVEIATGQIVASWPDIASGKQDSSFDGVRTVPPIALDAVHRRFAVASDDAISIIQPANV